MPATKMSMLITHHKNYVIYLGTRKTNLLCSETCTNEVINQVSCHKMVGNGPVIKLYKINHQKKLHEVDFIKNVPHKLSEYAIIRCLTSASYPLVLKANEPLIDRIVTCVEQGVDNNNSLRSEPPTSGQTVNASVLISDHER